MGLEVFVSMDLLASPIQKSVEVMERMDRKKSDLSVHKGDLSRLLQYLDAPG